MRGAIVQSSARSLSHSERRPGPVRSEPAGPEVVAQALIGMLPTLMRVIVDEMHDAPHTAGMNIAQFRVLSRLSERDYRAAELAACLDVGRPTLTVTAEHLVQRGLVERLRDLPSDRRGVLFRLTPAGRTLQRALEARAVSAVGCLLAGADLEERAALAFGLDALRRGLEEAGRSVLPAPCTAQAGVSA